MEYCDDYDHGYTCDSDVTADYEDTDTCIYKNDGGYDDVEGDERNDYKDGDVDGNRYNHRPTCTNNDVDYDEVDSYDAMMVYDSEACNECAR